MKILIISNSIWNLLNFRGDFLNILINNKHKIIVIAKKDKYYNKLKKLNVKFINFNFSNNKLFFIYNFFNIILLFFKLKKFNPNLVYSFSTIPNIYSGLLSYFFKNTKFINTFTGLGNSFIENNFIKKIIIIILRLTQKKISKIYFHNNDDRKLFLDLNIVRNLNTDIVYGSGLNFELYKRNIKYFSNNKSFLFIGRLIINKGIKEFIEASNKIKHKYPNTSIGIIGEYNPKHPNSIKDKYFTYLQNNKNIKYYNFIDNLSSYNKIINNYDCVVLPSYREGLPKSLIEACYLGKSIISSNVPGMHDVCKENFNGFQCEAKNIESLYKAMLKFIVIEKDKFEQFTKNSIKLSDKFYYKDVYKKYLI